MSTTTTEEKDKQLTVEETVKSNLTSEQIAAGKQMYEDIQTGYDEQYEALKKAQEDNATFTQNALEKKKKQLDEEYHNEMQDAYTDYTRETSKYGVGAEAMAASGMSRTGYSESARVRMYAAYQDRVAKTKTALATARNEFDIAMEQAAQQNNLALAELAFSAFQRRTELLISQFNDGLYEYKEQPPSSTSGDAMYDVPYFVNGVETPKSSSIISPKTVKYGAPSTPTTERENPMQAAALSGINTFEDEGNIILDALNEGYSVDKTGLKHTYTDEGLADALDSGEVVATIDYKNKKIILADASYEAPSYSDRLHAKNAAEEKAQKEKVQQIVNKMRSTKNIDKLWIDKKMLPAKYINYSIEDFAKAVESGELIAEQEGSYIRLIYPEE